MRLTSTPRGSATPSVTPSHIMSSVLRVSTPKFHVPLYCKQLPNGKHPFVTSLEQPVFVRHSDSSDLTSNRILPITHMQQGAR